MSPDRYGWPSYDAELKQYARAPLDWTDVDGTTVLVTGATGLIGSYLVDLLLARNRVAAAGIRVIATGRSLAGLQQRFRDHRGSPQFVPREVRLDTDVLPADTPVDYVVHAAGNAQPPSLQHDPVGTLMGNLCGTDAVLRGAAEAGGCRVLFLSSSEVYGLAAASSPLRETDLGPLDIHLPRASYPMAKRAAETLCISYQAQYGSWTAITRPAYVYGPTATASDTRVVPQFLDEALRDGLITLTSDGSPRRSYCYVGDCATGLLTVMTSGSSGEVYNISDPASVATIREVAAMVAELTGAHIRFANLAHATATEVRDQGVLDPLKLTGLGWAPRTGLRAGLATCLAARRRQTLPARS